MSQFWGVFSVCLFCAVSLFLIIDLLDRTKIFLREESSFFDVASYMLFKVPYMLQMMTPIAALIAALLTVGRLSQLSETIAMRACGVSVARIAMPLLGLGLILSLTMLVFGESVVPWSMQRVEEIYRLEIKKQLEHGGLSKEHFWHRSDNRFFNVGLYDSRSKSLDQVNVFTMDGDFQPTERLYATQAKWEGSEVGWVMKDISETALSEGRDISATLFQQLPLVIKETPKDFYRIRRSPETFNIFELEDYIKKLQFEGAPATGYKVEAMAKLAFPFVNFVGVLIAIPFALSSSRSGGMSKSFVAGVTIGFSYYVVHAISLSLGSAELIPPLAAAWSANVLLGCLGGYLLAGAEYA